MNKLLREGEYGLMADLEAQAFRNWKRSLVKFTPVSNEVIEVNTGVTSPVALNIGQSSELGVFARGNYTERPQQRISAGENVPLEVWRAHHRSALYRRNPFGDSRGNWYRDIDLIGIGVVIFRSGELVPRVETPGKITTSGSYRGFLTRDEAKRRFDLSEQFLGSGFRTGCILGNIKIKEAWVNDQLMGIWEMEEKGIIPKGIDPNVQIRGFKIKSRLSDLDYGDLPKPSEGNLNLMDAITLRSWELGHGYLMMPGEYLEDFSENLGVQVREIHGKDFGHESLTPHNITLLAEVVDLGALYKSPTRTQREGDIEAATNSLMGLAQSLKLADSARLRKRILNLFDRGYKSS